MKNWIIGIAALSGSLNALGQSSLGSITGNMESTFQYLRPDSLIGATQPVEKGLLNSYMNVFTPMGILKPVRVWNRIYPEFKGTRTVSMEQESGCVM